MARLSALPARYIPPAPVTARQPDLFGAPTVEHRLDPRPIPRSWGRDLLRLIRAYAPRDGG